MMINVKSKRLPRIILFTTALILLSCQGIYCQQDFKLLYTSPTLLPQTILQLDNISFKYPLLKTDRKSTFPLREVSSLRFFILEDHHNSPKVSYCQDDLAFFCRLEVKMEKKAKLPVKVRLGDVQYVDYLEGKYEAWRYNY